MSNVLIAAVAALTLAAATRPAAAAAADGEPAASHLWRDRVLVALAPTADDPDLARQRRIFEAMRSGARERDLVLIEAIDGSKEGDAFRKRFGGGRGFRAVLIGKDGGAKLQADRPLGPEALFPLIDSMPMRQDEIRRGR